ncbi:MAG: citrate transporter, partial [Treponema sp.]|nr:citrate transporter [Treponema sp.]
MLTAQILVAAVFLLMFFFVITEIFPRHLVTLGCGLLAVLLVFILGFGVAGSSWETAFKAIRETLNIESLATLGFWYTAAG